MRAAVIGGTGSVGRLVAEELARRGDDVRVLSRSAPSDVVPGTTHHPVDLTTGAGLDAALDGVDVVLDLANATKRPEELLVGGSRRAVEAGAAAGVAHHVLVSIVGCDRVPIGYYRVKTAQERVVADGPVPWSILRATQFHGLVAGLFEATARFGVRPRVRAPLQPIDPAVVASRLTDAAHAGPSGRLPDLGGPRRELVADLADTWSRATGRGRIPVRIPSVGPAGRALRAGGLCTDDRTGDGPAFAEWLAAGGASS
jgi:uncharacterized protein YbjT (DUF2867 family)